jgi:hypothetical protein
MSAREGRECQTTSIERDRQTKSQDKTERCKQLERKRERSSKDRYYRDIKKCVCEIERER